MNRERALELLQAVARGDVPPAAAIARLAHAPVAELGEATLDLHRALRQGFPEVVLAAGKTVDQTLAIVKRLAEAGQGVLVTRADDAQRSALENAFPAASINAQARTVWLEPVEPLTPVTTVSVPSGISRSP